MFLFAAQLFRECEPARRAQRDVEDAGGAWQVDTRRPNDVLAATFDALVVDPFSIPFGMQCERKERSYGTRRRGSRTPLAPESMLGHVWCQPHLENERLFRDGYPPISAHPLLDVLLFGCGEVLPHGCLKRLLRPREVQMFEPTHALCHKQRAHSADRKVVTCPDQEQHKPVRMQRATNAPSTAL